MPAARVVAQAKVNLLLRVLARESTGYHQVETLLCRLALGDEVVVRPADAGRTLACSGPAMPTGGLGPVEDNLAWRSAVAYSERTGWPGGFAIDIVKRIPVGAGLGGGSADAGAVLRALNALHREPLAAAALMQLAGSLGADVPFLTQQDSPLALAWGHGDRLLALPALPARSCRLFVPEVAVGTRDAYQWIDENPPLHGAALSRLNHVASWDAVAAVAANDFERVVGARVPVVERVLATLRSPGMRQFVGTNAICQLTGSGSAVFAIATTTSEGHSGATWRSDEPGVQLIETSTAERVEPVSLIE